MHGLLRRWVLPQNSQPPNYAFNYPKHVFGNLFGRPPVISIYIYIYIYIYMGLLYQTPQLAALVVNGKLKPGPLCEAGNGL